MVEMNQNQFNGYYITRTWFLWCAYNSEKIRPIHTAIYLYAVDTCNKLGWREKFGFPTDSVMEILGIGNWRTYSKALNELIDFGFIQLIRKSPNRHVSALISIVRSTELDAELNTILEQSKVHSYSHSNGSASADINKPLNHKKKNNKPLNNTLLSEINISDLKDDEKKYFEISLAFRGLFIKNLKEKGSTTNHQDNATYKAYVDPIRLMMQKDGVTEDQLKKVFNYLNSPEGEFWKSNILSTNKLREKFNQLVMKSNSQKTGNSYSDSFKRKIAEGLGVNTNKYDTQTNKHRGFTSNRPESNQTIGRQTVEEIKKNLQGWWCNNN